MSAPPSTRELALLERARALALRGRGRVSPNPLVGAVVAREGAVIGEGWHEGPGCLHAEAMALRDAGGAARGATVVCTLEPCSHHGRTPPCTQALIGAGVARVVVGTLDPLEARRAQGARVLRGAGVEVVVAEGREAEACRELNGPFLTWARTGRPQVTLKLATSLDGRIATATGESRWITGPPARERVHRMRADHDAVAVGVNTALTDDPRLTARDVEGPVRQPARVVFDTSARLPVDSALATGADEAPVLVIGGADAPPERVTALERLGVEVRRLEGSPRERLLGALELLGRRQIQSVLIEGGAVLGGALLDAGLVDRVAWFLAPMLIGGIGAPGALGGAGVLRLADAPRLIEPEMSRVGDDVLLTGRLRALPG